MSAPVRIRTITAGVTLAGLADLAPVEAAIAALERSRRAFEEQGYEVQTLRVATPPVLASLSTRERDALLPSIGRLDDLGKAHDVRVSLGPALFGGGDDERFPEWAAELMRTTANVNCSVAVTTPTRTSAPRAAAVAARAMVAIARSTPRGLGNFRFAAIANVPPGTPFFPAAYHDGTDAFSVGVEAASIVEQAFRDARDSGDRVSILRERLDEVFAPIEMLASACASRERRRYRGVDPSPAPGKDRSIGSAIEALTGVPFGSASTLDACATITTALKSLRVQTCGYAGLMLPVLEDPVLAQRAGEHRYSVRDLLLYSSVCGTGLDVVPLPGDTPVEALARLMVDVAALSLKLDKPLSARLFLIPGKRAGDIAEFDDPYLTSSVILAPE